MYNKMLRNSLLSLLLIFTVGLVACGGAGDDDAADDTANNGDKNEVDIWFSLSGANGDNFELIVDDFNEQSDSLQVNAVYQGSYTDTITKIRAVGESEAPGLLMASETNRKYMSEQDYIVPIQDFIDEEDFDTSFMQENVEYTYTVDDTLYSMPFSTSNAIMFYNKDMFEESGLDPENPPATFEELEEAAQTIVDETDNDGFSMATIGWFFEELLVNQGGLYLNEENGFAGEPTETLINEEPGLLIFEWIDRMNKAETFKNYGADWEDPRSPFFSDQLGMYFDSSANVRDVVETTSFEVGTAPLPVPEGVEPQGAQVGGNSIYITNKVSEEEQEGAWEFLKYVSSAEVQSQWASATGYFPINEDAVDEAELKETYEEFPQMKTAVEVNSMTPAGPATGGPLTYEGEEFRTFIEVGQEQVYEGEDPQTALDNAAEKINDLLQ